MARLAPAAALAAALAVLALTAGTTAARAACPGQRLREIPADPAAHGPWPVGLRTLKMGTRNMTVDVYYPALPGAEDGHAFVVYSLRDNYMPERQAAKIPDEADPPQVISAFRDIALDSQYGPYPVHIHIHGTGAFRSASAHQFVHMASRGFVVVAADHPFLNLGDMMRFGNGQELDLERDFYEMVADLDALALDDLAFLRGSINMTQLAASGHSAGGNGVSGVGDRARVVMSMAATGVRAGAALESVLVLAGAMDGIVDYDSSLAGYGRSPSPKRFVGVERAGHLFCTDLCWIGEEDGGIVQIAIDHGIYMALMFQELGTDGCAEGYVKNDPAWNLVDHAMSAAQEEVLMCDATMGEWLRRMATMEDVHEFHEEL